MNEKMGKKQLILHTFSLLAGFMVWTLLAPLFPEIVKDIPEAAEQQALIVALPVILGSVLRIPFGILANKTGARTVFLFSFIFLLIPVFYLSIASTTMDLMIAAVFLGIGGATFSIGVTSLPKYYPKEKHGFVNGVYGMGNIGTAVTSFGAPALALAFGGWQAAVQTYLVVLALFAILQFIFGDKQEKKVNLPLAKQFKEVIRDYKFYFFNLWYFITFGAFVAFGLFLPSFLTNEELFGLTTLDAGVRTAVFIIIATLLRPVGGMIGDKFNALHALIITFVGLAISGLLLAFTYNFIFLFTVGSLLAAVCAGIGNGLVFKFVPTYFSKQAGISNGFVAMMGGLGGFFPPIVIDQTHNLTGSYALGFILLAVFCIIALFTMFYMNSNLKKNELA
ncbi:nitrate/nitrite transporter [Salinicoccus roseus]|uniref:nitrate/nitrite transporter n=1 Tax=Salinicoccus roseus TaxID=45670 RepID=UPI0023015ACF|nr:nitrate/nitrite transporter [Salinicoccus roseus]